MRSLFNLRPIYITLILPMRAQERANQRRDIIVILQVKHPIIRQGHNRIHHYLQAARNITIKRLISRILYPLINRQFHILPATRAFSYYLIARWVLFLRLIVTKMSVILAFTAIDTSNILVNHGSIIPPHLLRLRLGILIQIYLIRKDSIQPLRITLKLYYQMIRRVHIRVVFYYLLLTLFT